MRCVSFKCKLLAFTCGLHYRVRMSILLALVFSKIVFADPANVSTGDSSGHIAQDVVPPVLIEQAVLHYPVEALPSQIHGTVVVDVHISIDGVVETVSISSGHVLFHHEAKIAAKRLRFSPATQDNKRIPFNTTVSFHFTPPHLEPRGDEEHPHHSIVVSSDSLHNQTSHVEVQFDEATLDQERQIDLARSLESVAGVEFASGASNNSKPLIRGQTERRLQIVRDGISHSSQKWGVDHAPEIDVFDVGQIRVRKGAEAVRYGGDAVGGVILIDSPMLPQEDGVFGKTLVGGASNGRKGFSMGRVDMRYAKWAGRLQANGLSATDVQTPLYILGNTASKVWNTSGILQHTKDREKITFKWSHYQNQGGVFYGMRAETPADLDSLLSAEVPPGSESWILGRDIDKPYQRVDHTKGILSWEKEPTWGSFSVLYGYQRNDRVEAEPSRIKDAGPQYNFLLHTHTMDVLVDHAEWILGTTELDIEWGVSTKLQDNLYSGYTLIPNYRQIDLGGFMTQKWIFSKASLSTGVRFDTSHQDAYLKDADYDAHARRDLLPEDCLLTDAVAKCTTQYSGDAFILGGVVQIVPESLEVRGDISTGTRFPNVDERYLLGAAPSFPVYAMGDPNLSKEKVRSGTLTIGYRNPFLAAELSAYTNRLQNYIYFAPWVSDGMVQNVTMVQGSFPIYKFQSIDAHFYGVDGTLTFFEDTPFSSVISGATVRAWNTDTGQHLVGIPPDSIRIQSGWKGEVFTLQPSVSYTASQSRAPRELDFADVPEDFWLLNLQASLSHSIGQQDLVVNLNARNLLNRQYRRYTSLIRYYADEPGRDVQLSVSTTF